MAHFHFGTDLALVEASILTAQISKKNNNKKMTRIYFLRLEKEHLGFFALRVQVNLVIFER